MFRDEPSAVATQLVQQELVKPMVGPKRRPARVVVEVADLGGLISAKFERESGGLHQAPVARREPAA